MWGLRLCIPGTSVSCFDGLILGLQLLYKLENFVCKTVSFAFHSQCTSLNLLSRVQREICRHLAEQTPGLIW